MRYPGSKQRYARELAAIVEQYRGNRTAYVEPFVGGGNSFAVIAPMFATASAGDAHEDIALMWAAVAAGWEPPVSVTEEEYQALRHAAPSALRGFVGSACSFGGKWFGGYARGGFNGTTPRDHQAESARAVMKAAPAFRGRTIRHCGYQDWRPDANTVVYCDPPYAGTLKYSEAIDHDHFWRTAREWAEGGALILVSEQSAPDGWVPVLTFGRRSSTALAHQRATTEEHVYRLDQ